MEWEFFRFYVNKKTPQEVFEELNKLEKEGWEVIQYNEKCVSFTPTNDTSYTVVLKRPVRSEKKVL